MTLDFRVLTSAPDAVRGGPVLNRVALRRVPPIGDPGSRTAPEVNAALKKAAHLCGFLRADPDRPNTPIMMATNPLGSLLLGSGAVPVMGAIGALVGPRLLEPLTGAMPLSLIGVDVHQRLHRLEVRGVVPDRRRGVRASNTVGESFGTLSMRWMLAPDDFEPVVGQTPPPTPLDPTRSQKFVMLDGRQRYDDAGESGFRGFGSGRTYPVVVNGQAQLRIAAVVDVLEGFGKLEGLSGTLVVNGHLSPPSGLFISFFARFLDPDGRVVTHGPVPPSQPLPGPDPDPATTFLLLVGEATDGPQGPRVNEQLRLLHTGIDAGSLSIFQSEGPIVGNVTADLEFEAADSRPAQPIRMRNGVFTFTDRAGDVVGTLSADMDGQAFPSTVDGPSLFRFGGFGPLIKGTGAFDGAVGMMSTCGAISVGPHAQANVYMIRLSDPGGRYRLSPSETLPISAVTVGAAGRVVDHLDAEDRKMLSSIDRTRRDTLQIQEWWRRRKASGDYAERVELVREFNQDEHTVGFFDTATVDGKRLRLMGVSQEMFYDRPKKSSPEEVRDQLREFVLGHFMRVSHTHRPEPAGVGGVGALPLFMRPLSWLPDLSDTRVGFGYQQLLYKLRDGRQVGKFLPDERGAIVDLRTLGSVYDWLAMRVNIFDFKIAMSPFGPDLLKVEVPLEEVTYLLMTPEMVVDRANPSPDVLGEYGFGYGLLPYAPQPDLFAYGPGHFDVGYQSFVFRVLTNGEIRAEAEFVVNRPDKMLSIDVDPIAWGFKAADRMTGNLASRVMSPLKALAERLPLRLSGVDPVSMYISAANALSGGLAASQLGISKTQLEKFMLMRHFIQHRQMLISSQLVWRMVPDWTDADALPEFCHRGLPA
jgi:hypothetical protein